MQIYKFLIIYPNLLGVFYKKAYICGKIRLDMNTKFYNSIRKIINPLFCSLFLLAILNLLYMHYQFCFTIGLESAFFKTSFFDNLLASLLDVSLFFLFSWLITCKKIRFSLAITFFATLVWSFCNSVYSRFFNQYLPLSSLSQIRSLGDDVVINSTLSGLTIYDCYYPIVVVIFLLLYIKSKRKDIKTNYLLSILFSWFVLLPAVIISHTLYVFNPEFGVVYELRKTIFTPTFYNSMWPNWVVFHKGIVRTYIVSPIFNSMKSSELTQEQREKIETVYKNHTLRVTERTAEEHIKNVIFILVESYLSISSDLMIDGKEITPNLNSLKQDSSVYYNGHMRPNITIGESSDGQFIYMTGILPLRSELTVTRAKHNELPGLPTILKDGRMNYTAQMIIPTSPTLWEQQYMAECYGFTDLLSLLDYQHDMNIKDNSVMSDEKIIKYASLKDKTLKTPFFSIVLTMSMHHPFDSYIEHGFHVKGNKYPQQFYNYLTTCHYTDQHIGQYLNHLKEIGLYDNSLIIITSDHDAHLKFMDMEGKIPDDLPLYIINGGFQPSQAYSGECNQLDVYTTILDIMGIESKWRGLGHTLLNKNYQNSINDDTWKISEWIIRGNYFKGTGISK